MEYIGLAFEFFYNNAAIQPIIQFGCVFNAPLLICGYFHPFYVIEFSHII